MFSAYQIRQQLNRSVDDEKVKPSIVIVVKEERAETREATAWHSQAGLASAVFKESLTEIHIEGIRLVHQVGHKDVISTIAIEISRVYAHTCFGLSVSVDSSARQKCIVHKRAILLIDPELVWISIVCDVDVHPTIVIEIRCDYSQPMTKLLVDSRGHRYVFEDSVAFVVKESISRRAKNSRRAVVFCRGGRVTGWTISD